MFGQTMLITAGRLPRMNSLVPEEPFVQTSAGEMSHYEIMLKSGKHRSSCGLEKSRGTPEHLDISLILTPNCVTSLACAWKEVTQEARKASQSLANSLAAVMLFCFPDWFHQALTHVST
jgi:hypothetical protein